MEFGRCIYVCLYGIFRYLQSTLLSKTLVSVSSKFVSKPWYLTILQLCLNVFGVKGYVVITYVFICKTYFREDDGDQCGV